MIKTSQQQWSGCTNEKGKAGYEYGRERVNENECTNKNRGQLAAVIKEAGVICSHNIYHSIKLQSKTSSRFVQVHVI